MAKKRKATSKTAAKGSSKKNAPRRKKKKSQWTRKHVLIALGVIIATTFIAYSPLLQADFVDIDDKKLILDKGQTFLENPMKVLRFVKPSPHYKPVTYAFWTLEYRAVGPNPFVFHFNNLLLHLLNCVLVFFLTRKVARQFDRVRKQEFLVAFFTALLFGLHPMHVESVGWVVERKDVLYTAFYLLSLVTYVRYLEKKSYLFLGLSALAYLLSVFSKAPGITAIAVIFLLDFAWRRKISAGLFLEKAGHFGVFGLSLYALGFFSGSGEGSLAALVDDKILAKSDNVKNQPKFYGKVLLGSMRAWLWYIHSLIPVRLSLGYPREAIISFFGPTIHVLPVALAAGGAALLYYARRYRLLFFAHAFFFITLAPAIVRLGLGIGIFMSDRYVYLSLFGLLLLIASWILTFNHAKLTDKMRQGILAGIALLYAIGSFSTARTWHDTETLWTNVIEKYPNVDYAHVNRGAYYRENGQYDRALADLNRGIEIDDNLNARIQRGLIYRQSGQAQLAIADYTRALELEPGDEQALINRGNAYLDAQQYQLAINDFNEAIEGAKRAPNVRAAVNRAIAYASLGDFNSAQQSFALVEARAQDNSDFWLNRAIMWVQMRQHANAIADYDRYLLLVPDDHQIHFDKGIVYAMQGQHQNAIQSMTTAIGMSPVKQYYTQRAKSYDALGMTAEAQADRARAQ